MMVPQPRNSTVPAIKRIQYLQPAAPASGPLACDVCPPATDDRDNAKLLREGWIVKTSSMHPVLVNKLTYAL